MSATFSVIPAWFGNNLHSKKISRHFFVLPGYQERNYSTIGGLSPLRLVTSEQCAIFTSPGIRLKESSLKQENTLFLLQFF